MSSTTYHLEIQLQILFGTKLNYFQLIFHREFVTRLREANKTVYLITGGFDCLIEPVANELGIPLDHMFANKLHFHFNGTYYWEFLDFRFAFFSWFLFVYIFKQNYST